MLYNHFVFECKSPKIILLSRILPHIQKHASPAVDWEEIIFGRKKRKKKRRKFLKSYSWTSRKFIWKIKIHWVNLLKKGQLYKNEKWISNSSIAKLPTSLLKTSYKVKPQPDSWKFEFFTTYFSITVWVNWNALLCILYLQVVFKLSLRLNSIAKLLLRHFMSSKPPKICACGGLDILQS